MAKRKTNGTLARLKSIEERLTRLEQVDQSRRAEERETAVEPWSYLVRRKHAWRKQLYVLGRNLTARQLVGSILANELDDAKAAANYHLPIDAIREARAYVEKHRELLETEAEIERLMHKREGVARAAQSVS
jgi:hypothetical protein